MPDFSDQPSSDRTLSCLEMLQLMIDGDATPEQEIQFREHMEACLPCYQTYNLEIALKELLKSKCSGNGAPPDLIERIKMQISQSNLPR
jgi:anti-sigma factor (TIGR02949 family)